MAGLPRQILRDTIQHVEEETDTSPDDPSLAELKRNVVLKVAALDGEHAQIESADVVSDPAKLDDLSGVGLDSPRNVE